MLVEPPGNCPASYRWTTQSMKVETNIITSVSVSPMERVVILVIMYVKTFKTDIIDFIGQIRMCLMSHWLIIFCILVRSLIPTISPSEIKGKMSEFFISKLFHFTFPELLPFLEEKKRCMSNFIFIFTNHMTCVWDLNWRIEECKFVI
jgi:hypothetical protein